MLTCIVNIVTLFTIAKIWKQPKHPSADKWIKTMWGIYTQWSITQPQKRIKSCHLQQHAWTGRVLC